ncbi:MAG: hypothetical protein HY835_07180 [Anaerolineae bacterium]|nr:hypothetical protein [Anaerolineae bacterium]
MAGILSEETAEDSADALPIEAISQPETVTPDIAGVESPQIEAAEEFSEPPTPVDAATPDWIAELAGEMEQAAPTEVQTELPTASHGESSEIAAPPEDMDAALAWMEALAARQGADAETLTISQPEERSETPPDWLQELSSTSTIEDTQPNRIAAESTIEQTVDAESFDISPVDIVEPAIGETLPLEEQEVTPDQAEPAGPDLSDMDSALAWMEALAARQGADAETLAISKLEDRSETPPDWIRELALEEETPTQEVAETLAEIPTSSDSIFVEPAQAETMPVDQAEISGSVEAVEGEPQAEMDADAAFAWMEALAARQGAEEGTLITEPEARVEEPPQWIAESEEEIVPTAMDVVDISALDTTQEEPAPWADQIEPLVGEITEQPVDESQPVEPWAPETEIIPDLTTPDQEQIVASQDIPAVQEADIPSWLLSYEEETKTETRVPEATPEEMPTWLQEETPPTVIEPAADTSTTHEDAEPVMPEWLKALQDSQPATETSVPTPAWAPVDTQPPATISASDEELIAQAALRSGDIEGAVKSFTRMINTGSNLEKVIKSIQDALDQHPINVDLWQTMGDAYMRANRIQDALDAYTKAEELLR